LLIVRTLHMILYIIAALCFLAATALPLAGPRVDSTPGTPGVTTTGWWPGLNRWASLLAAGLLAWVLVPTSALIEVMVED
jgi:hypothetical protein